MVMTSRITGVWADMITLKKVFCFSGIILLLAVVTIFWYLNPYRRFNSANLLQTVSTGAQTPDSSGEPALLPLPDIPDVHNLHSQGRFNVLILGLDARKKEESRTDVIVLANIDPINKKVNVISIPRDTRVELPEVGYTKINHAHLLGELRGGDGAGTEDVLMAVGRLMCCPIHYYIKVRFNGFACLVDLLGGLEVTLTEPVRLTFYDTTIPAGRQTLNGEMALKLTRERYSLAEGDFARQRNQRLVVKALAAKLLSAEFIPQIPELAKLIKDEVLTTNLAVGDMISLALVFHGVSFDEVQNIELPGRGIYALDPLLKTQLYYWEPELSEAEALGKQYF